jgi:hypothetical protein
MQNYPVSRPQKSTLRVAEKTAKKQKNKNHGKNSATKSNSEMYRNRFQEITLIFPTTFVYRETDTPEEDFTSGIDEIPRFDCRIEQSQFAANAEAATKLHRVTAIKFASNLRLTSQRKAHSWKQFPRE